MSNDGRAWVAPVGSSEWTEVGHVADDGLATYTPEAATFRVRDDDRQVRAWARVGPDGVLTLDAPLVEVDPQALWDGFKRSIGGGRLDSDE